MEFDKKHYNPYDNPEMEKEISKFINSCIWYASSEWLRSGFYTELEKKILENFPFLNKTDALFRYIRRRAFSSRDSCLESRRQWEREQRENWEHDL